MDRALRDIAARRAALDADEARWLREAEALQIWRPLGMVSALDYLERVLGYAPRTAQERLRVARALGDLPQLTAVLSTGDLAFSSVRELTRVATPATEAAWIAAATGKNLRQVEEIVADHRPGDQPDDPPDPQARTHIVRFELSAETFALLRQTRTVLDDEHGTNLPDDAFIAALCSASLDDAPTTEPTGRAKYQIALTLCARCRAGTQEGAGVQVPINPAAVDRALCDAQHIGSLDESTPDRAYQDIPPSVARLVWRRDGGRCRIPGCRSSRGLELHHIVHRADGGGHDISNVILTCSRATRHDQRRSRGRGKGEPRHRRGNLTRHLHRRETFWPPRRRRPAQCSGSSSAGPRCTDESRLEIRDSAGRNRTGGDRAWCVRLVGAADLRIAPAMPAHAHSDMSPTSRAAPM